MNDREGTDNGASASGLPRRNGNGQTSVKPGGRMLPPTPPALPRDPVPPPPSPKRFNAIGILLAFVIAAVLLPFTMKFQKERFGPITKKAYRMTGLDVITEMQAVSRFGTPLARHDFSMSEGSVAGPQVGQKKYWPLKSPDYAKQMEAAEMVWRYPQYSTIREMIWKLPDSFLTIWFHEPRAEIDLSAVGPDGQASISLPDTSGGDWVSLDNFRLGNDLVREMKGPEAVPKP